MKELRSPEPTAAGSIVMVIVHGVLWVGLLVPLLYVAPRFLRIYQDFGLTPPMITRWTFVASAWAHSHLVLLPIVLLAILVVDGAVHFWLRCGLAARWSSRTWFALGIIVPLAIVLISGAGIWLALDRVIAALSTR